MNEKKLNRANELKMKIQDVENDIGTVKEDIKVVDEYGRGIILFEINDYNIHLEDSYLLTALNKKEIALKDELSELKSEWKNL